MESMELCDTPSEVERQATEDTGGVLQMKSRLQYERIYELFNLWCAEKGFESHTENVLLAYFKELSESKKPSTLWSFYSMLRTTLNVKNNVEISKYKKLISFLKQKSSGYKPKKSKTFTKEEVQTFLNTAPDSKYLFTKTALIFGIMGVCQQEELCHMDVSQVEEQGTKLIVHIPDSANKIERQFVISGNYYKICKKYMALRPTNVPYKLTRFFLNYQHGKCTKQPVGINKFGSLAKEIAKFLKLPDLESYTGHCIRKTSAILAGRNPNSQYMYHPFNNERGTTDENSHSFEYTDNKPSTSCARDVHKECDFTEDSNIGLDSSDESGGLIVDDTIDRDDKSESNSAVDRVKAVSGKLETSAVSFNNLSKQISNSTTGIMHEIYQADAVKQVEKIDCTVCTRNDNCTSIFNLNYKGRKVSDIFQDCTGLKIKAKSFLICDSCTLDLLKCYQFVAKCRELPSVIVEKEFQFHSVTIKQEAEDSDNETSYMESSVKLEPHEEETDVADAVDRSKLQSPTTLTINRDCSGTDKAGKSSQFAKFTADERNDLNCSPEYVNVSEIETIAALERNRGVKQENFDFESSFGRFKKRKKDDEVYEKSLETRKDHEKVSFQSFQAFSTEINRRDPCNN